MQSRDSRVFRWLAHATILPHPALLYAGDLYSRDPYTEEEAARISSSILSAIAYMHSKNIIHRDLKYENILFVNTSPKAEIKLIDFGLSAAFGQDALTDGVGTMYVYCWCSTVVDFAVVFVLTLSPFLAMQLHHGPRSAEGQLHKTS